MVRTIVLIIAVGAFFPANASGQQIWPPVGDWESSPSDLLGESPQPNPVSLASFDCLEKDRQSTFIEFSSLIARGQDSGGGGGAESTAMAAEAVGESNST